MIQSLVLVLVDTPSVANACADTSLRALKNIDSLYFAPLVLRVKVRERQQPAVSVANGGQRTLRLSHIFSLEISQSLALDLGLNEEQYAIWVEMEMAPFSVLLHCRKYVHSVHLLLC